MRARGEGGQAAVELALALPVVALLGLGVVQAALVVRDEVLVVHAAREAARAAAVDQRPAVARAAAARVSGLDPSRLEVDVVAGPEVVTATVRYRSVTDLPLIGALVPDLRLHEALSMRREATEAQAVADSPRRAKFFAGLPSHHGE